MRIRGRQDAFILQSFVSGVLKVNQKLQEFSDNFRHRFKGGSKRAGVLPVGYILPLNSHIFLFFFCVKVKSSSQLKPVWHPNRSQLCFGGFSIMWHRKIYIYVLANPSVFLAFKKFQNYCLALIPLSFGNHRFWWYAVCA